MEEVAPLAMVMQTRFDPFIVIVSILVAILASCVALNFARVVIHTQGRARAIWLAAGAFAMGTGIWSMHFVGMLAFEMPGMAMAYDVPLMILSIVVAVVASALALFIVSLPTVTWRSIVAGGTAFAVAIAGMHYIGMYSMRMDARIEWNLVIVAISIAIAFGASLGALKTFVRLREKEVPDRARIAAASLLLGLAISGMHYTGMIAATFVHDSSVGIESSHLLVSSQLVMTVVFSTLTILGLALAALLAQKIWLRRSEQLGRSEERFRLLVEAVKEYSIIMLDPDGRITTWNTGAERINGYSEREVLEKHVSVFYTQEDIDERMAARELKIAKETGHFEGEGRRLRKDGSEYWASVMISPLFDRDGTLRGYSKVTRDITAEKALNERMRTLKEELEQRVHLRTRALSEREHQLRTITNAAPVLLAQLDREERILFANEAFCRWFECDPRLVLGRTFRSLLGEDRYPANKPYIEKALAGQMTSYERFSRSGEVDAILGVTFVPEFTDAGHVTGFVIVASDVTKYKETQEELRQAKEAAEVANATKSAFLANMSHEIRTPLGAVLGFSELLANDEIGGEEKLNVAAVIKRNGRILSDIINDILDLSKVEAGKLEVERVDVPFNEVLKELGTVLSLEARAKGIELLVATGHDVPKAIQTDPLRLRQVLLNIVGNAIKFTKYGSVRVNVRMEEGKVAFIVIDTGEGINPEQVERLFTPFTQADVSMTRKFGGTGLGLVLSRKLAQVLGGDVRLVETAPGKGSTFVVTIDPGVVAVKVAEVADTVLPTAGPGQRRRLDHLRVLVVDDSEDNQELVGTVLSMAGAKFSTASNGAEAVELALAESFDVVLMDLQMPVMDGYEATRRLRAGGFKNPIIALTAHAMEEERQRTLRSGFDAHLTKPIDRELLIQALL